MENLNIPLITVLGSHYTALNRKTITQKIIRFAESEQSGYVCVANVHTTMMGYFNSKYRSVTNHALLAVPDGMPLVWAMKLLGNPKQDRVRGPTLMRRVCEQSCKHGLKHYLLGGTNETLLALEHYLKTNSPSIKIAGKESPPFRHATDKEKAERIKRINNSGAQILWVGLGAPKQENWMWEHRHEIKPLMIGVGAAFDLLPGVIPEAPAYMQAFGLEWLYRLVKEPKRLWRRYIFNNPLFLILLTAQVISSKFSKRNG